MHRLRQPPLKVFCVQKGGPPARFGEKEETMVETKVQRRGQVIGVRNLPLKEVGLAADLEVRGPLPF